jgi:hypothetical protein
MRPYQVQAEHLRAARLYTLPFSRGFPNRASILIELFEAAEPQKPRTNRTWDGHRRMQARYSFRTPWYYDHLAHNHSRCWEPDAHKQLGSKSNRSGKALYRKHSHFLGAHIRVMDCIRAAVSSIHMLNHTSAVLTQGHHVSITAEESNKRTPLIRSGCMDSITSAVMSVRVGCASGGTMIRE